VTQLINHYMKKSEATELTPGVYKAIVAAVDTVFYDAYRTLSQKNKLRPSVDIP
jgi:Na+-transporting NADH:ubiquinone oxidoreductase subunit NqrB